jgi:hypothetical protein
MGNGHHVCHPNGSHPAGRSVFKIYIRKREMLQVGLEPDLQDTEPHSKDESALTRRMVPPNSSPQALTPGSRIHGQMAANGKLILAGPFRLI